ncbi:MAG: 1-deoxy-D-xylulose-5-phosphate reductoisomerase [bacterium]
MQSTHRQLQKRVSILGSTGSVGVNTLDQIAHVQNSKEAEIELVALTANNNVQLLAEQAKKFRPQIVAIANESKLPELSELLQGEHIDILAGPTGVVEAAQAKADWVMAAIVGAAGLAPVLAAAKCGADLAIANKECLVCAGNILTDLIDRHGGRLLPVDSEHNAIFQVFDFNQPEKVSGLILTASGGPFREFSLEQMKRVTPEQAVAHPNWDMGAKISVDSATMMNKGLELIEAAHIFPVSTDKLSVLVHPQSVIHSMVEYVDGSVLAQLGSPDMRVPIASALAWPQRISSPSPKLNLAEIGQLQFYPPDLERFPALGMAMDALTAGGVMPAILNAANEIAVAAFLNKEISFLDIANVTYSVLDQSEKESNLKAEALQDILAHDVRARKLASTIIKESKAA